MFFLFLLRKWVFFLGHIPTSFCLFFYQKHIDLRIFLLRPFISVHFLLVDKKLTLVTNEAHSSRPKDIGISVSVSVLTQIQITAREQSWWNNVNSSVISLLLSFLKKKKYLTSSNLTELKGIKWGVGMSWLKAQILADWPESLSATMFMSTLAAAEWRPKYEAEHGQGNIK